MEIEIQSDRGERTFFVTVEVDAHGPADTGVITAENVWTGSTWKRNEKIAEMGDELELDDVDRSNALNGYQEELDDDRWARREHARELRWSHL